MNFDSNDWAGSFYDLSIDVGKDPSGELLMKAVKALWQCPNLSGPWGTQGAVLDYDQRMPVPEYIPPDDIPIFNATLTLPRGQVVGVVWTVIYGETSSLELGIPLGMLERVFPLDYPLDLATNPWLTEVDGVLIGLAETVHKEVPFHLALIGEEAAGYATVDTLTTSDIEQGGVLVSPTVSDRFQPTRKPTVTPTGLHWYSFIGPHMTFGG